MMPPLDVLRYTPDFYRGWSRSAARSSDVSRPITRTPAWRAEPPTYSAPEIEPDPPALVPHTLSGNVPAGRVVRTFDIEGICCNGCPGKLFVKLDQLEGVEEAAVDPVLKQASVVWSFCRSPQW